MQEIIFYNYKTGTYVEFKVEFQNGINFFKNNITNKEINKSFLDVVFPYILEFGGKVEFPGSLLEAIDDSEIDLFLLASYIPAVKETLLECLYMVVPKSYSKTYIEVETNERLLTEAVGTRGVIIYKEKSNGGLLVASVSYKELEMNFRNFS